MINLKKDHNSTEPSLLVNTLGTKAQPSDPKWDAWVDTLWDEADSDWEKKEHKFPPDPPSLLRGVGDGEWAGLLDLVKRNKKRPSSCATPQKKALSAEEPKEEKAGRRVLGAKVRRSLGGRLQLEGKLRRGRPRPRRADLRQPPKANTLKGGRFKWKAAIKTAKLFKVNQGRGESAMKDFQKNYYANSSRKAKASVRKTVEGILDGLGVWGGPDCWLPQTLEQVGAVLKESNYKAGGAYLSEYKQLLIEKGKPWTHQLQRMFTQVTRARGPTKKAAEVPEDLWMEKCRKEVNETKAGQIHNPALMFAFATVWMLREVELAAIYKEDITIEEKGSIVALNLRITKGDQEGLGVQRTLQCCCEGDCDWSTPCAFLVTKTALDAVPIEEDKLVHGDTSDPIEKSQIIAAWRDLFGRAVSGHSGRRSGALQYIRRGWQVPQVAYLGRWKSNIILQYAEEALETMPVMAKPNKPKGSTNTQIEHDKTMKKGKSTEYERKLKLEIDHLKKAQEKLDDSIVRWEEISKKNQGLLPPTVISCCFPCRNLAHQMWMALRIINFLLRTRQQCYIMHQMPEPRAKHMSLKDGEGNGHFEKLNWS